VKDLTPSAEGSYPFSLTAVGSTLYFSASSPQTGSELWKTDGTANGTVLVAEVASGSVGSYPSSVTEVAGTLFFVADDGVHGDELWKVDSPAQQTSGADIAASRPTYAPPPRKLVHGPALRAVAIASVEGVSSPLDVWFYGLGKASRKTLGGRRIID
jgi:ELWxxDGT repeat protein